MGAGWVSAAAAVISVLFAIASWWEARCSRRARAEARQAEANAKDTLETLRRLADAAEGPKFKVEHDSGPMFRLVNLRGRPFTVDEVLNLDQFTRFRWLEGQTVPPHAAVLFTAVMACDRSMPANLVLRVGEEVVAVQMSSPTPSERTRRSR